MVKRDIATTVGQLDGSFALSFALGRCGMLCDAAVANGVVGVVVDRVLLRL